MSDLQLTVDSLATFVDYAKDAPNWGGTPLVGGNVSGSAEARGNLTDLKRKGLIRTSRSDGHAWVYFTEKGVALAHSLGIQLGVWGEDLSDLVRAS